MSPATTSSAAPPSIGGSRLAGVGGAQSALLGLVGVEVVQDHMQLGLRKLRHDAVHELQELPPTASMKTN